MEIPVDPDIPNVGDDFITCHALDETPDSVIITLSGVLPGNDWLPGDPPPPNEPVVLTQVAANFYTGVLGIFNYTWGRGVAFSFVEVEHPDPVNAFFALFPACVYSWPNIINGPVGTKYYGGVGSITWAYPSNTTTIGSLASAFGLPVGPDLTYLPYPIDADSDVIKFQDPSKINKISIKRDFS